MTAPTFARSIEPILTRERQITVLAELVTIADSSFAHMEALKEAGFAAFVPDLEFGESFCETSEIQFHRRCVIETAKETIGSPSGEPKSLASFSDSYGSPLLDKLRRERDTRLGATFPAHERPDIPYEDWHIDPCLRRKHQVMLSSWDSYRERETAKNEATKRRRSVETAQHSSGLAGTYSFDKTGRWRFIKEVFRLNVEPLGFAFDQRMSSGVCPVFAKALGGHWCLCWMAGSGKNIYNKWRPDEGGRLKVYLHLRREDCRGHPRPSDSQRVVWINYQAVVPAFAWAYAPFHNLDDIEAAIKAHVFLYRRMADHVEATLKRCLGG